MKDTLHIRKVIEGKVYDTDTALFVHALFEDKGSIGLNFFVERTNLYRTRRGQFFIAGESGALKRWGQRYDDSYGPGRGLKLVSDAEAQRFLEESGGPVEQFFEVADG
jgi:hypothetical protein